ncbi:MAG: hypothetical protein ACI9WU_004198, partial [Myxococcota bacterium]
PKRATISATLTGADSRATAALFGGESGVRE